MTTLFSPFKHVQFGERNLLSETCLGKFICPLNITEIERSKSVVVAFDSRLENHNACRQPRVDRMPWPVGPLISSRAGGCKGLSAKDNF